MNTTKSRTLKQRIKSHAPEIAIGAALGLAAYVFVARHASVGQASNFFKNAADPTVEIIFGDDNAFAVLTSEAMEHLHENSILTLLDGPAGTYSLMFANANA